MNVSSNVDVLLLLWPRLLTAYVAALAFPLALDQGLLFGFFVCSFHGPLLLICNVQYITYSNWSKQSRVTQERRWWFWELLEGYWAGVCCITAPAAEMRDEGWGMRPEENPVAISCGTSWNHGSCWILTLDITCRINHYPEHVDLDIWYTVPNNFVGINLHLARGTTVTHYLST